MEKVKIKGHNNSGEQFIEVISIKKIIVTIGIFFFLSLFIPLVAEAQAQSNDNSSQEEVQHLKELLDMHRANLRKLEKDAAVYGAGEVPLRLQNQIDREKEKIKEIEKKLGVGDRKEETKEPRPEKPMPKGLQPERLEPKELEPKAFRPEELAPQKLQPDEPVARELQPEDIDPRKPEATEENSPPWWFFLLAGLGGLIGGLFKIVRGGITNFLPKRDKDGTFQIGLAGNLVISTLCAIVSWGIVITVIRYLPEEYEWTSNIFCKFWLPLGVGLLVGYLDIEGIIKIIQRKLTALLTRQPPSFSLTF
jgi:hypothetical protein